MLLKSLITKWENQLARMVIMQDLTDAGHLQTNIADSGAIENLLLRSVDEVASSQGKELICGLLQQLAAFFEADAAYVLKVEKNLGTSYITYEWSRGTGKVPEKYLYNVEIGRDFYKSLVTSEGVPLVVFNIEELKKNFQPEYNWFKQRQVKSFLWMPYQVGGLTVGYVCLDNFKQHGVYFQLVRTFTGLIFQQIKLYELEEQYEYAKYNDLLTNLFNRRALLRDLDALQGMNCSTGILVVGINEFEALNYRLGNSYGDRLLRMVANILKANFASAKIYHQDNDRFVVVRQGTTYEQFRTEVKNCAKEIAQLYEPGTSAGLAWNENCNVEGESLLQEAALRMQRNRLQRSARLNYQNTIVNLEDVQKVKEEIASGRFKLVLQGQVNRTTGQLFGVEALVRYMDVKGKILPPEQFISQFEHKGVIRYLDLYVLEQVCVLMASWKKRNMKVLPVAVSLSARTMLEPGIVKELCALTDKYAVSHRRIYIEITKNLASLDREKLVEVCANLQGAGFKLCLADFGSEYVFVQTLTLAAFNVIKFDKSLIKKIAFDKDMAMVCRTLMQLCTKFGYKVLAEGVESREGLKLLDSFKCKLVQGGYFSPPLEILAFEQKYFKNFIKLARTRGKI